MSFTNSVTIESLGKFTTLNSLLVGLLIYAYLCRSIFYGFDSSKSKIKEFAFIFLFIEFTLFAIFVISYSNDFTHSSYKELFLFLGSQVSVYLSLIPTLLGIFEGKAVKTLSAIALTSAFVAMAASNTLVFYATTIIPNRNNMHCEASPLRAISNECTMYGPPSEILHTAQNYLLDYLISADVAVVLSTLVFILVIRQYFYKFVDSRRK